MGNYFETTVEVAGDAKLAANWVRVELLARLKQDNIDITSIPVPAEELGILIARIRDGSISGKIAKTVFEALWLGETKSAQTFIEQNGLIQVSDIDELAPLIDAVLADNPIQVEQFKAGKTKLMGFFVGQIMKRSEGKANPQRVNELLKSRLLLNAP